MASFDEYKSLARENKPIEFKGLTFKPLTVRQFDLYQAAKPSFELLQSSLPPKFAVLSWCNCLDELDKQSEAEGTKSVFLPLVTVTVSFAIGLQLIKDNGVERTQIQTARDQNGRLLAFVIGLEDPVIITMSDMDEIRKIIAAQNGYEIPDELWNPELVRAQKYTASLGRSDIDYNFDDLVYSVAFNSHRTYSEVLDWTIRDFINMQSAIDRTLNYQIFTLAEHSGFVKFKKGNPYPTWKFNRRTDMPSEFKTIAEMDAESKGLLGVTTKEVKEI